MIQRIRAIKINWRYPVDSDLSIGQCYQPFEQLGQVFFNWRGVSASAIRKCFAELGDIASFSQGQTEIDPFADLDKELTQMNVLLNESSELDNVGLGTPPSVNKHELAYKWGSTVLALPTNTDLFPAQIPYFETSREFDLIIYYNYHR